MNDKTKVLYIAGFGRSGSTIISQILGSLEGFFHAGEACFIWERGCHENTLCGCRNAFSQCSTWQNILDHAFGSLDHMEVERMRRDFDRFARTRHLPALWLRGSSFQLNQRRYLNRLGKLYRSIQATTQCRIVVDSSKLPSYGFLLDHIDVIDLYVVHLVRDPRAVTYSWGKKMQYQPGSSRFMERFGPTQSSLRWNLQNAAAERFWRHSKYMRLRYEDFMTAPADEVLRILSLVNEQVDIPDTLVSHAVTFDRPDHALSGNPSRFKTGCVELKQDSEWQEKMRQLPKWMVTGLTLPLLLKYRYGVR